LNKRKIHWIIREKKNISRPKKPYDSKEVQIVILAYTLYRFGARMLEVAIRKIYKTCISHNRIHMYLKASGLAQDDPNKKKRRKWVRYERKHSLSAGHIDWHEWDGDFKQHLEKYGIKPILIGAKHPQTNGKLEQVFGEYMRHRHAFSSFEEFIERY